MATKQTLKQLLGASDSRKQVDLNLGTPALSPTIQTGRRYSIATPSAPRTNNFLRLAESLKGLSPALRNIVEANQIKTERQNLEFDEKLSTLDLNEKRKLLESTEDQINDKLRGEYALNPIATIRAKKLIGATAATRFGDFFQQQKEEYIAKFVSEQGEKPTTADMELFVDEVTNKFFEEEGNENLKAGGLIQDGFMQTTNKFRTEQRVKLSSEMAEIHKKQVLMPKTATALKQAYDLNPDENAETLTEAWRNAGPLNAEEQTQVIGEYLSLFPPEETDAAMDALVDLKDAGISVGNQKLEGSSLFIELNSELHDRRRKYEQQQNFDRSEDAKEYVAEIAPALRESFIGGIEAFDKNIESLRKSVEESADEPRLKEAKLEALRQQEALIFQEIQTNARRTDAFLDDSNLSVVDTRGLLENEFALIIGDSTLGDDKSSISTSTSTSLGLGELVPNDRVASLMDDAAQEYKEFSTELIEDVNTGNYVDENNNEITFDSAKQRARFINTQLRAKQKELISDLRSNLEESLKEEADVKAAAEQKKKDEEAEQAEEEKIREDLVKVTAGRGKRGSFIQTPVIRTNKSITDYAKRLQSTFQFGFEGRTGEGLEPRLLDQAQRFLNSQTKDFGNARRSIFGGKRTKGKAQKLTNLSKDYFTTRRIGGYTAQEINSAIRAGVTEHGFPVTADFFRNEMTLSIIDLSNVSETEALAETLGVTVEELKSAQTELLKAYNIE